MAITYTKEQRERAKLEGWSLGTLGVTGFEFQGPVAPEERDEIVEFMAGFLKRRGERLHKAKSNQGENP